MILALFLAAVCTADSAATLNACSRGGASEIRLAADIVCTSEAECCPGGSPLLWLSGRRRVEVDGQGHTLTRLGGQRACSAIKVSEGSADVAIHDLTLREDAKPCDVEDYWDGCADTVLVHYSERVTMDRVHVLGAAGTAVLVWGSKDVAFRDGSILGAGMLGLSVGHELYPPAPERVVVERSRFEDVRTNALVIAGGRGHRIEGNTFLRNHGHGLWLAPDGRVSGGGQVFLAMGDDVLFRGNTVGDGWCDNCAAGPTGGPPGYVDGVEIGEPGGPRLRSALIANNTIHSNSGDGIIMPASTADEHVEISSNILVNNWGGIVVPGARLAWNAVLNARVLLDLEEGSSWGPRAHRWCPGPAHVLSGQCALRIVGPTEALRVLGPVVPGQAVYLGARARSGGWVRSLCLVFLDAGGREINAWCASGSSTVWAFEPDSLQAIAPDGAASVAVRVSTAVGVADFDDIRVTW